MSWSHGQNHVMKLAKLETSQLVWITLKTTDQQPHPPCLTLTFQQSETPLEVFELFLWAHGILGFVHDCRSFRVRGFEKLASSKRPTQQPTYGHGPETLVPSGSGCAKKRLEMNGHTAKSFAPGCQITQTSTHTVTYIHTVTYSYYDTWMCTTPTKKGRLGAARSPAVLGVCN